METLFEMLFLVWCPRYDPDKAPAHLRDDPVQAYGQYAFREGFELGMALAVDAMEEWTK